MSLNGGGYEEGYQACSCFWGTEPGSLVRMIPEIVPSLEGARVLDAGCGEGKNAHYLASKGALVRAVDVSSKAIENGRYAFADKVGITWQLADVRCMELDAESYEIVVAYGLLHCLQNEDEVTEVVRRFKKATIKNGVNIICAFNDRYQELSAHPGFTPLLLGHQRFLELYSDWNLICSSDSDLTESHPHNRLPHRHSMTRLIARKVE